MDGVRYREITVKTALTRVQGMPFFSWSLNPYKGCAHACTYCYAREYHARMGRDTGAGSDREIDVKMNFAPVLRAELRRLRLRETAALGTGTDPYQPCEGRYRLARGTLEALCESPLPLVLITKGSLVVRDIDLLARLGRLVDVRVCLSIATLDAEVAKRAEPQAPPPRARLEAVRRLRAAGIEAGVLAAPVLPGLTDDGASLEAVAAAAKAHDASFFHIRPLKLDPSVRPHYVERLEARVDRIRSRHGFREERHPAEPAARVTGHRPARSEPDQMRLAI